MDSDHASRLLVRSWLKNFNFDDHEGSDQLEREINKLEYLRSSYKSNSTDPKITARARARARDLEQNAAGLISGIKWALSFIEHRGKENDISTNVTKQSL